MQHTPKLIVTCFAAISLLAAAGCQRNGSTEPTAAVRGPDGQATAASSGAPAAAAKWDPLHPVVVFDTTAGTFSVRLDAEKAPLTVDNFLRYVNGKHYDGTIIHQVQKNYPMVVLGGAMTADLKEKTGQSSPVRNEADNGLKNRRGTIAMARRPDIIDSATAMFFINLSDNSVLDYKARTPDRYGYCVFGEVTEGLNVVDNIAQVAVHDTPQAASTPISPIAIKSVKRVQ